MRLQSDELNDAGKIHAEITFLSSIKSPYIVEYFGSWILQHRKSLWVRYLLDKSYIVCDVVITHILDCYGVL